MLTLAGIGILIQRAAVETRKRMAVAGKVSGNPVEQNADSAAVQVVDEEAQIVRVAMAAGRCEVARGLVAPGFVERMLHDRQQLDVGEPQGPDVLGQGSRELAEAEEAAIRPTPPRAEMYFVDAERAVDERCRRTVVQPVGIAPVV